MGLIMGLGALWICVELYRLTKDIRTPKQEDYDPPAPTPKVRWRKDDGTPL